jgi:hypothetical protein
VLFIVSSIQERSPAIATRGSSAISANAAADPPHAGPDEVEELLSPEEVPVVVMGVTAVMTPAFPSSSTPSTATK